MLPDANAPSQRLPRSSQLLATSLGALALAALSTLGDWVWIWVPGPHPRWMGILHGALQVALIGAALGAARARLRGALRGAAGALIAGTLAALAFYALAPLLGGRAAMVALWAGLWVGLGLLCEALSARRWLEGALRGLGAALLGGLSFWLAILPIWSRAEADPSPLDHGLRWLLAYAPGLLALTLYSRGSDQKAE